MALKNTPRHMGNPAEGVSYTSMSSKTQGTLTTSFNNGIDHDDDVVAVSSQYGTRGFLDRQSTQVTPCVSAADRADLVRELNTLRETLGLTQSTLDVVQALLSSLETNHTRTETQLDLLIRMQQPVAKPTFAAQEPPDQTRTYPDTA